MTALGSSKFNKQCASSFTFLTRVLVKYLGLCSLLLVQGCTLLPMKTIRPIIAPLDAAPCVKERDALPIDIQYELPTDEKSGQKMMVIKNISSFESYRTEVKTRIDSKLPADLARDHVTIVFRDFLTAVSAEAQLAARVQNPQFKGSQQAVLKEQASIEKYNASPNLKPSELKNFARKLFDLQMKHGPADFLGSEANVTGLTSKSKALAASRPKLGIELLAYLKAYYDGKFYDRMSTAITKPQLPTGLKDLSNFSIPDSEIVAAETVLLEFLIDSIDPTPIMVDNKDLSKVKKYYPGDSENRPTALATGYANFVVLEPDGCGITTNNVWVLKDLANAASDQATAIGGLVTNTFGGVSIGLGVLGKISVGDNQTLSNLVKGAASELALRATLATSYYTLRNVKFNPPKFGT